MRPHIRPICLISGWNVLKNAADFPKVLLAPTIINFPGMNKEKKRHYDESYIFIKIRERRTSGGFFSAFEGRAIVCFKEMRHAVSMG